MAATKPKTIADFKFRPRPQHCDSCQKINNALVAMLKEARRDPGSTKRISCTRRWDLATTDLGQFRATVRSQHVVNGVW
jgi:hypothetical protein